MTFIEMIIFCVVVFMCLYVIINRICTCVEHRYTADAYQKVIKEMNNKTNNVK